MNGEFCPGEFILAQFESMGAADRCRLLDAMHDIVGPCAPIPAFEDIAGEAQSWAALCDDKTLTIFMDAIVQRWLQTSPARVKAASQYLAGKALAEA